VLPETWSRRKHDVFYRDFGPIGIDSAACQKLERTKRNWKFDLDREIERLTAVVTLWQNEEAQLTVGAFPRCMIRSMENETIPSTLNKLGKQFCCQQLELLLVTQPKQHVRLLMKERLLQNKHLPSVERCLISNRMVSSCVWSHVILLFSVGGTPEG
jgi:hypothetical protein